MMHENVQRYWNFVDRKCALFKIFTLEGKGWEGMDNEFNFLISEAEAMNLKSNAAKLAEYRDRYCTKEEK